MTGYVVESIIQSEDGKRQGHARVYVATEARAKQIVSEAPGRTWRAIDYEDMPEAARKNLERAKAEGAF